MKYFKPFFLALGLLTQLPIPSRLFQNKISQKEQSLAVLYYPFIGLIMGSLLFGFACVLNLLPNNFLIAVLLLITWVILSGALHLDGLADCVDAAFASHSNLERTLSVMKDPSIGPMGVCSLILVLLLKAALLYSILNQLLLPSHQRPTSEALSLFGILAISLSVPRFFTVIYINFTPYARTQGLAAKLRLEDRRWSIVVLGICTFLCTLALSSLGSALVIWGGLVAIFVAWRHFWIKRIQGYTGDCLGGFIELSEILCLLLFLFTL